MPPAADRLLIVSPVYNEAAHVDRTARAVAAQTRRPDRWVIVDDGSTDDTVAVARRWERELDFLTVVQAPQDVGPGADNLALARPPRAFNLGLEHAGWSDYEFIGKLDGDVELPPTGTRRCSPGSSPTSAWASRRGGWPSRLRAAGRSSRFPRFTCMGR